MKSGGRTMLRYSKRLRRNIIPIYKEYKNYRVKRLLIGGKNIQKKLESYGLNSYKISQLIKKNVMQNVLKIAASLFNHWR